MTASTSATDREAGSPVEDVGPEADVGPGADAGPEADAGATRRRRRLIRWVVWTSSAVVVLLVAVVVDGIVVANRIRHVDIALPVTRPDGGSTYLILGSDSRADLPAGVPARIGTTGEVPGARADVVLVVHVRPDGSSSTLSLPRDLIVINDDRYPRRLALTLLAGPQSTVNAVCRSLGIPTTHLVMIDLDGFAAVVDAVGGVTVDIPYPVRDQITGLAIATVGRVRLDGVQAIALVRSRHPEQLVRGAWVPMSDAEGTAARTRWAGVVFAGLRQAAARAKTNPVLLQRLAWTLTGAVTTDSATGMLDLLDLAAAASSPVDLPVDAPADPVLGAEATPDTRRALVAAGLDGGCTPRT